jgi:hypothetical protein
MQGLTGGGGGDRRVEYILPKEWRNEPDARHVLPTLVTYLIQDILYRSIHEWNVWLCRWG